MKRKLFFAIIMSFVFSFCIPAAANAEHMEIDQAEQWIYEESKDSDNHKEVRDLPLKRRGKFPSSDKGPKGDPDSSSKPKDSEHHPLLRYPYDYPFYIGNNWRRAYQDVIIRRRVLK